nr:DUF559 domain-containing protein [Elainella sp. Prado103]
GNRIENITDWALEQFRRHYGSPCPAGIPLVKGDTDAAPLDKGGSRGDQIDYAAIAQQRNLPYKKGHLPYNPKLVERAKVMRKDMTKAEKKLWYDFLKTFPERILRQRPIDHFIIDFYCPTLNLVIEVDGGQHYSEEGQETDAERTAILESYGLQVLRFSNHEVLQEFESVCQVIEGMRSPCPADIPLIKGDTDAAPLDKAESSVAPLVKGGSRGDQITKLDIFHYTYAVLHHPAYRTKYELNLKREFPRLPFYADFHQWATWGKALMDLHLNYETIEPYGLRRVDVGRKKSARDTPLQTTLVPIDTPDPAKPIKRTTPKAKLKADKTEGTIILDTETTLEGVPAVAWDYKLGNRSALEWILDQYKEKKPKDPTIAKLFNTYKFADYKEHVIDLLQRVCTVSVRTMEIIQQMPDTVEHKGG